MKKIFFFDIDGTLLEFSKDIKSIPQTTRVALDHLKSQKHHLFVATGRCQAFVLDGVKDYPFHGYVTCNGAYVEHEGRCVYKKVIPAEAIRKTQELCLKKDMFCYFEGRDSIYVFDKTHPKHLAFKGNWGMKDEIVEDRFCVEDVETYIGMIIGNTAEDEDEIVSVLTNYFDVQKHHSGNSFDLTIKGESKAKGIMALTEALGIAPENTVAFGDGFNDIEMLSEVGLGIAMGNAADEVKAVADYVTDDVDKDGIAKALTYFSF